MKKTKIKQVRGSSAVASIPSGAANSPVINSDRGGSHSQKNSPGILPPVKPFYLDDGTTFIGYHAAEPDHSSVQLCRDGFLLRLPLFPPSECCKLLEMTTSFSDWDALFDRFERPLLATWLVRSARFFFQRDDVTPVTTHQRNLHIVHSPLRCMRVPCC